MFLMRDLTLSGGVAHLSWALHACFRHLSSNTSSVLARMVKSQSDLKSLQLNSLYSSCRAAMVFNPPSPVFYIFNHWRARSQTRRRWLHAIVENHDARFFREGFPWRGYEFAFSPLKGFFYPNGSIIKPRLLHQVISLNIRFSGDEVGQLDQGVFEMLRREMGLERRAILPLLDQSNIGGIFVVLQQTVTDASRLLSCRLDQSA